MSHMSSRLPRLKAGITLALLVGSVGFAAPSASAQDAMTKEGAAV